MNRYYNRYFRLVLSYLLFASAVMSFHSCIKDDDLQPCPPLRIDLSVKDKNYFNVDKVDTEVRLKEDLPFKSYVPTLYYRLERIDQGKDELAYETELQDVQTEESVLNLRVPADLPYGTYVLHVWGGLKNLNQLSADRKTLSLHPEETEGLDVYATSDTLTFDAYNNRFIAEMQRVKGKIVIEVHHLPQQIFTPSAEGGQTCRTLLALSDIASQSTTALRYDGKLSVSKDTECIQGDKVVSKMLAAPSALPEGSPFHLKIHNESSAHPTPIVPPMVRLTMRRNQLTAVRYVYDPCCCCFDVYVLINDNWELVHGMIIE